MVPALVASPPGTMAESWVPLRDLKTAVAVAALSVKVTVSTPTKTVPLTVTRPPPCLLWEPPR
jgi:hypothetical protein